MAKLRFAPIIRVSTEQQAQKGESLHTQRAQIEQYVEYLGGTIPEHCWQYTGQEHATPNQERSMMDTLLSDSAKDLFDAVRTPSIVLFFTSSPSTMHSIVSRLGCLLITEPIYSW